MIEIIIGLACLMVVGHVIGKFIVGVMEGYWNWSDSRRAKRIAIARGEYDEFY